jgi:hypothetical protein
MKFIQISKKTTVTFYWFEHKISYKKWAAKKNTRQADLHDKKLSILFVPSKYI